MSIGTDLTVERIQDSFAAPQTISFWDLPGFIGLLEDSGFASNRHRMHWHSLLASPVVFIAMVLIGAAFSMRHARFGGLGIMALGCVHGWLWVLHPVRYRDRTGRVGHCSSDCGCLGTADIRDPVRSGLAAASRGWLKGLRRSGRGPGK